MSKSELPSRLRSYRSKRGLSREELSSKIGISEVTLLRWETGTAAPDPSQAALLEELGLGLIHDHETNVSSSAKLDKQLKSKERREKALAIRDAAWQAFGERSELNLLPSPYVRNGPPNQSDFHRKLIEIQVNGSLSDRELVDRLAMVEEVGEYGKTAISKLEKPTVTATSWNSNYGAHGWHRYVGRFPPHVVRALINSFGLNSASKLCDPFLGSGTTALESQLLGIPFVGIEICPLSAMISRVKTQTELDGVDILGLEKRYAAFFNQKWGSSEGLIERGSADVLHRPGNPISEFKNYEKWFTSRALLGTSITVEFALTLDASEREAILLALSSTMRSIGNVDVDVVRAEYRKSPRENVDVQRLVSRHLHKMARSVEAMKATHPGFRTAPVEIIEGSALSTRLSPGSIDAIITSPPYGVESLSYLRTHLLSYRALQPHLKHDPYDLRDETVGAEYLAGIDINAGERALAISPTAAAFFRNFPPQEKRADENRRLAMLKFCDDMLRTAEHFKIWLRDGGKVAFVLGNKRLKKDIIPMDAIVRELFDHHGIIQSDSIKHKLKTNNSNSQVPWQERTIQDEYILCFEKV
jgi:transcriptional regulator with XRE-family HTH domain/tRNA G10  N-methylase Trm11